MILNFHEQLEEVEKWTVDYKILFFNNITRAIPIGVREVVERDDISCEQKNEAFRTLSEFHHEINKIISRMKSTVGMKFNLIELKDYVYFVVKQNDQLIKVEIANCLKDAFEMTGRMKDKHNVHSHRNPSIYELFESKESDEELINILGSNDINCLEGFINGYFYAIDSNEIKMHGTRFYPNLQRIENWLFGEMKGTGNWKSQLLAENKVLSPLNNFLRRFREKITKDGD